ncbi:MAG: lytic murein transglycosylase [Acinetobacter sp.]|nr:lytic murein transglycosylase [Acinetobacter sp.]
MKKLFPLSVLSLWVAACTTVEYPKTPVQAPVQTQPAPVVVVEAPKATPVVTTSSTTQQYDSFDAWKSDFTQRAIQAGHSAADVQRLLANAQLSQRIISLDKQQPEFTKMPWDYAQSAISSVRVSAGQKNFAAQRDLLTAAENQYGVPASIVTAIWGVESSYGQGTGSADLASALATLAYEGRRRAFAEEQLLAMLTLLQRGDLSWSQLKGSWAGGMGHTQFIPATWLSFGVDGNGDQRRSPWTEADALSSTANYLSKSGWVRGLSPFYEVTLPAGFDYTQTGTKKTFAQWQQMGVKFVQTAASDLNATAELWLPAGVNGPALLLSKNFEVIRVYNNSLSYALAVSSLAKAIVGLPGIQKAWPTSEQPLTTAQAKMLQQRLTAAGYDTQGVDGVLGTNSRKAFQRWQAANGHVADGFISQRTASALIY